jgi:drug/metabolite transporter (DMT)-like permease
MSAPVDLVWGAVGGLFGTTGFLCMLRGFAIGRISIVAPVSALIAAAIPVLFSAYGEGLPSAVKLFGFALAFASVWMLSSREHDQAKNSGFAFAVFAGLGFGLFFTTLDFIGDGAVFWPLAANRLTAILLLAAAAVLTKRRLIPAHPPVGTIIASGVLDVSGNFLFLRAVQTGRLDVATVLVSLYPAVTVLWATIVAKEHLTRLQAIGVAVAVFAIALITV